MESVIQMLLQNLTSAQKLVQDSGYSLELEPTEAVSVEFCEGVEGETEAVLGRGEADVA